MEYIILGLLILNDMTIYELNANFSVGLNMIYSASYGSIQYAIKKLLSKNMISFAEAIENGRNKKIYSVNEKGKAHFYNWMMSGKYGNDFETVMLGKVYFLGLIEDLDEKNRILYSLLKEAQKSAFTLDEIKKSIKIPHLPPKNAEIASYQLSTLDYGIGAHTFAKHWLKKLIAELE